MPTPYEQDYHRWAMETAAALREGRTDHVDLDAIAEELEHLGRSEKEVYEAPLRSYTCAF
jgi:hypothetical protein